MVLNTFHRKNSNLQKSLAHALNANTFNQVY